MRRRVGRITTLTAGLVLAGAGISLAQVAVPEIAPVGIRILGSRVVSSPQVNVVPDNPAALLWGTPSRVVAGALRGGRRDVDQGASSSYDGSLLGFRWVQARTALAAEAVEFEMDFPVQTASDGATYTPHLSTRHHTVALAFNWPEPLALGVSSERTERRAVSAPAGAEQRVDFDGWVAGLSWRLGEHVFLGWGYGQEEARTVVPATPDAAQRTHNMVGLGARGSGRVIWRLEADLFQRDNFTDGAGQAVLAGHDLSLLSGEAVLGRWLFGTALYDARLNAIAGAPSTEVEGYTADFGYVPLPGLALTFRYERGKVREAAVPVSKESVRSLLLAWQF